MIFFLRSLFYHCHYSIYSELIYHHVLCFFVWFSLRLITLLHFFLLRFLVFYLSPLPVSENHVRAFVCVCICTRTHTAISLWFPVSGEAVWVVQRTKRTAALLYPRDHIGSRKECLERDRLRRAEHRAGTCLKQICVVLLCFFPSLFFSFFFLSLFFRFIFLFPFGILRIFLCIRFFPCFFFFFVDFFSVLVAIFFFFLFVLSSSFFVFPSCFSFFV